MKKVLLTLILSINISLCFAQSPASFLRVSQMKNIGSKPDTVTGYGGPGPTNPWMAAGIQAGYNFFSGSSFENNFQASGRALLEVFDIPGDKFNMFLMGNLSRITSQKDANNDQKIKELQQSNQGINVGLFPHMVFGNTNDTKKPHLTAYLPITYKVNAFERNNADIDKSTVYLNQFRVSAGAEVSFLPGRYAKLPCTLSLEPAVTMFNKNDYAKVFNKSRSYLPSFEATLIIPAGIGRGLLLLYSTSPEKTSQFMAGLILVGSQVSTE